MTIIEGMRTAPKRNKSFSEFDRVFKPLESAQGSLVHDLDEVKSLPNSRVWSLIDDGQGTCFIMSGYHLVNLVGYMVTENARGEGHWPCYLYNY